MILQAQPAFAGPAVNQFEVKDLDSGPGDLEFQSQNAWTTGQPRRRSAIVAPGEKAFDDNTVIKQREALEIQLGITDWFRVRLGVEFEQERLDNPATLADVNSFASLKFDEVAVEGVLVFVKPKDEGIGLGLLMEYGSPVGEMEAAVHRGVEALHRRSRMRQSAVRGFVGGRVDLIPHQLYIAREVAARLIPRVLLADEVGLGKTIEAGLILHRLHLTGRADRILILVPEPLIHQWFIEMLRRFNLLFSIFDDERCEAIEMHDPGANPFLDSQLVICNAGLLAGNQ